MGASTSILRSRKMMMLDAAGQQRFEQARDGMLFAVMGCSGGLLLKIHLLDEGSILPSVAPVALAPFLIALAMQSLSYPALAPCTEWVVAVAIVFYVICLFSVSLISILAPECRLFSEPPEPGQMLR